MNDVDIWIDRVVLHFLVDDRQVEQYFRNVHASVKPVVTPFLPSSQKKDATKCAGLDVRRYDTQDLEKNLIAFELIVEEEYIYTNPGGDPRPYNYTLFKRKKGLHLDNY